MADIGKVNLKAGFNYKLSVRNQTVALLFTWKKKIDTTERRNGQMSLIIGDINIPFSAIDRK